MSLGYRYPGVKPFLKEDKNLFFGRDSDIAALFKLINVEQLVLLYSKSGLGKSSILNAGLSPILEATGNYEIINIRFGAWKSENKITPIETLLEKVRIKKDDTSFTTQLVGDVEDEQLWHILKSIQVKTHKKNILIILDQFEELFTYPETEITEFKRQLAEVLYVNVPQKFRTAIESKTLSNPDAINNDDLKLLYEPLNIKLLMSIRGDKMSLLNSLKDFIPNIYHKTFELTALDATQAEEAILKPAYKRQQDFFSNPFDVTDEALDSILNFLTKGGKQKIESFQLQIICQYIETLVIDKKLSLIGKEHLGEMNDIFENYYDNLIAKLPTAEDQKRARIFIEEKLIYEEDKTRLSIYEKQILRDFNVNKALLAELVNSHLIRAEPNTAGLLSYELSHDTLVDPILKAKAKRVEKIRIEEEEKKILVERELAEKQQKKLRNTQLILVCISILALFSILAGSYGYSMQRKAKRTMDSVITINIKLLKSTDSLKNYTRELKEQNKKTEKQRVRADSSKVAADVARNAADIAKNNANAALKKARRLTDKLNRQINFSNDQYLAKSSFMHSLKIDSIRQQEIRELLLSYMSAEQMEKYYHTINRLDTLATAVDSADVNPNHSAYLIKRVYPSTKNATIREQNIYQQYALPLFNKYIFEKQAISPDYDAAHLHTTAFVFSPDRTKFAYNVEEDIVEGKLSGDSLILGKKLEFKHSPHLTSIGLNNAGEIVAREKSHLVYSINEKKRLLNLPVDSNAYFKLSPDGSILLTLKDNVPLLWKTSALIKGQQTNPIPFKDFDQTIYSIAFSPDNQLIAIGHVDGVSIFDFTGKLVSTRAVTGSNIYYEAGKGGKGGKVPVKVYVRALNFSRDSKSIIIGTSQQEVIISNLSKVQTSGQAFNFKERLNYIGSVSLSPDERNILAGSADDGKYFVLNIPGNYFKNLPIDTNIIYADFLSSNTILSVGYHGKVTTYGIPPKFSSLSVAVKNVLTLSPVVKKESFGRTVSFADLMLSNDPQILHDRGKWFQKWVDSMDSLMKAKQIFTRLVAITGKEPEYDYLEHLIDVNTALNLLKSKNYFAKVDRLKENITLYGDVLRLHVSDSVTAVATKSLSNNWGDLAYNQLFIRDYKGAILSSQNGLQLIKTNDWIYTNLALGYLLSGEFDKAKAIYLQYKDKNFYQSKSTFKKAFLDDLVDLESEGIITIDNTALYAHVKQIRDLLK